VGGIHREATISIDGVTVRFDPAGFAQANRHLLPDLSRALRTAWTGGALVDLYAGAGLLTALTIAGAPPAAPDNRPAIICVEPDERNARFISENLSVLGFSDTVQVVKTTAERAITGEPLKTVDADTTTVLVDPPRGGLSKAVSRWLVGARGAARATDAAKAAKATDAAKAGGTTRRAGAATAERIIYVSCDAAALARDVGRLNAAYQVNSVTLLDFYPQTAHIEALVVLDRRRVPHS
jgi:23S rRNA (uracil1939-C5)-methyltransferase